MVWLCLEICDSKQQIQEQLEIIKEKAPTSLTSVSFERYTLSPEGTFIVYPHKNLSIVNPILKKIKGFGGKPLETYPMLTSHPYDSSFILWMRKLFKNPKPFIDEAIKQLEINNYDGYNVDFEPKRDGIVPNDAKLYADFLTLFANRLHQIGKRLQVDVAVWSPLWDYKLLSQTTVDDIITMSTYAGDFEVFKKALKKGVDELGLKKYETGLMIVHPQTNRGYNNTEIEWRMKEIVQNKVKGLAMWRTHPVLNRNSYWWVVFHKFLA